MQKESVDGNIFKNLSYYHYLVQYIGDIKEEFLNHPFFIVTVLDDNFAILSIPKDKIEVLEEDLKSSTIVYLKLPEMYTLEQISPVQASQVEFLQIDLPLNLTGEGVDVAVIDTGIDYLNEELMDLNNNTRINLIWDQTIDSNSNDYDIDIPFGKVFTKNQIQGAIDEYKAGRDPYKVVDSKDIIGHGTEMAGLIGATGKDEQLKGIASKCNFISIKMMEDYSYKASYDINIPVYNVTVIYAALQFLYRYSLKTNKPLVIYMPFGSNLGNHRGKGVLDYYIDFISMNAKIVVVTCTGNERITDCHASGNITEEEKIKVVELDVSPGEKKLWLEIWADAPNIISAEIVSPSGENSGIINSLINVTNTYSFVFEKTIMKVAYHIPEELSGDELIRIQFYDLQPGIWKIRLFGNLVLDGNFNVWISQTGLTKFDTRITPADTYGTIANPGNADFSVTVAGYNQNNNNMVNYSGMAFSKNYINAIDVAAGAVNALTIAPSNKNVIVNGTCVSGCIVSGACAMLFEWGVLKNNDPYMYSKTLKTYLARGVMSRNGDMYPNAHWGYGILNILNMFKNLM
ncbi:S8 family peptidase [Clostridium sp. BJN0001]|uniref:S8 family peptidase n=1 Tax=Clostridium sp. BJN0001 TaxID=2930219 RepID=UPI001FD27770|nr:S8 family peptidase [Clostridium sp. BJN0001]